MSAQIHAGFAVVRGHYTLVADQTDADRPPTTAVYATRADAAERAEDMAAFFDATYSVVELFAVLPEDGAR